MKDDRFMYSLRGEPRPEFARSLWRRLMPAAKREDGMVSDQPGDRPASPRRLPLVPGFAVAAVALAIVAVVLIPSVRASAQAFLDLFRVRSFTAVQFDPARLERFRDIGKNMSLLVIDKQKLNEPYLPSDVPDRHAAEAATGIPVLEPGYIPDGLVREKLQTMEDARVRVGTSTEKLRALIDALDLRDVDTPEGLDGKWIDVHMYPSAVQRWGNERRHVELVQARSPEVTLPPGLGDLSQLGEVGLRILGLDREEASRIARSIDWHSTLLVPVPMNASGFREVSVRGNKALLVTTTGADSDETAPGDADNPSSSGVTGESGGPASPGGVNSGETAKPGPARRHHTGPGSLLLWTEGDRVFALGGNIDPSDIMEMAESLR